MSVSSLSSWHQNNKTSATALHRLPNEDVNQHLSLDAELNNGRESSVGPPENEKRSLFGKFKAKLAQALEGDSEVESDRVTSPERLDTEKSRSSISLSTPGRNNGYLEQTHRNKREDTLTPPFSPLPPGLPPSIPEEPAVLETNGEGETDKQNAARPVEEAKEIVGSASKETPGIGGECDKIPATHDNLGVSEEKKEG